MTNIADTMQSLYQRFGDIPGVQIELHRSLLAIRIDNENASATVFLQGAQLSHYERKDEPPIIWCSPLNDYSEGKPLRGGIPVCWPWFGDLDKNPDIVSAKPLAKNAAAHGLARNRLWQLDAVEALNPGQTRMTLSLDLKAEQEQAWPFATHLSLEVTVGEDLRLAFNVRNHSDSTVTFSSALHTYFAVSHITQVSLEGLQGLDYIDCMLDWSHHCQQGALSIDREVDRIYLGTSRVITLQDQGWARSIAVQTEGSDSTVVWNPWNEKARRLSNFPDSAFADMLCIETANADQDCVTLEPGCSHQLAVTITGQALN